MLRTMAVDTSWRVRTWSGGIVRQKTNFAAVTFATEPFGMLNRLAFITLKRVTTESDQRIELGSN